MFWLAPVLRNAWDDSNRWQFRGYHVAAPRSERLNEHLFRSALLDEGILLFCQEPEPHAPYRIRLRESFLDRPPSLDNTLACARSVLVRLCSQPDWIIEPSPHTQELHFMRELPVLIEARVLELCTPSRDLGSLRKERL
jgi:hypothetical protein